MEGARRQLWSRSFHAQNTSAGERAATDDASSFVAQADFWKAPRHGALPQPPVQDGTPGAGPSTALKENDMAAAGLHKLPNDDNQDDQATPTPSQELQFDPETQKVVLRPGSAVATPGIALPAPVAPVRLEKRSNSKSPEPAAARALPKAAAALRGSQQGGIRTSLLRPNGLASLKRPQRDPAPEQPAVRSPTRLNEARSRTVTPVNQPDNNQAGVRPRPLQQEQLRPARDIYDQRERRDSPLPAHQAKRRKVSPYAQAAFANHAETVYKWARGEAGHPGEEWHDHSDMLKQLCERENWTKSLEAALETAHRDNVELNKIAQQRKEELAALEENKKLLLAKAVQSIHQTTQKLDEGLTIIDTTKAEMRAGFDALKTPHGQLTVKVLRQDIRGIAQDLEDFFDNNGISVFANHRRATEAIRELVKSELKQRDNALKENTDELVAQSDYLDELRASHNACIAQVAQQDQERVRLIILLAEIRRANHKLGRASKYAQVSETNALFDLADAQEQLELKEAELATVCDRFAELESHEKELLAEQQASRAGLAEVDLIKSQLAATRSDFEATLKKVGSSETACTQLHSELQLAKAQIEVFNSERQASEERSSRLTGRLESHQSQIDQLVKDLAHQRAKSTEFECRNESQKTLLGQLEASKIELQTRLDAAVNACDDLKRKLSDAQRISQDNASLAEKVAQMSREIEGLQRQCTHLETKSDGLEKVIGDYKRRESASCLALASKAEELQALSDATAIEINALSQAHVKAQIQADMHKAMVKDLQDSLATYVNKLDSSEKRGTSNRERVVQLEAANHALVTDLEAWKKAFEDGQKDIRLSHDTSAALRADMAARDATMRAQEGNLTEMQAQHRCLENRAIAAEELYEELKHEKERLSAALMELQAARDEEGAATDDDKTALSQEIERLKSALAKMATECGPEYEQRIRTQTTQMLETKYKNALASKENELKRSLAKYDDVSMKLQAATEQLNMSELRQVKQHPATLLPATSPMPAELQETQPQPSYKKIGTYSTIDFGKSLSLLDDSPASQDSDEIESAHESGAASRSSAKQTRLAEDIDVKSEDEDFGSHNRSCGNLANVSASTRPTEEPLSRPRRSAASGGTGSDIKRGGSQASTSAALTLPPSATGSRKSMRRK